MARLGLVTALCLSLLLGFANGHGTLTHPTPRGHFDADGNPSQIYENDPSFAGNPIIPNSEFVCRNRPPAQPTTTLTAGQTTNIRFDMSTPHVGDCALYLSYDVDKPATEMRFFKITAWENCLRLDREFISTMLPAWLPNADHAVLRFEWIATHVYPGLELFNQCADVRIVGGRPAGSSLPNTYTIGNHIPSDGNAYCDPYNGPPCTKDDLVFPPDAQDPTGGGDPPTNSLTNPNPPSNPAARRALRSRRAHRTRGDSAL